MKKIDETEEICVVDYLIPRTDERIFDYTKVRRFGEDNFTMKIDINPFLKFIKNKKRK